MSEERKVLERVLEEATDFLDGRRIGGSPHALMWRVWRVR